MTSSTPPKFLTVATHWGYRDGEKPFYGKCECGMIIRFDRTDLMVEHYAVCEYEGSGDFVLTPEIMERLAKHGIDPNKSLHEWLITSRISDFSHPVGSF